MCDRTRLKGLNKCLIALDDIHTAITYTPPQRNEYQRKELSAHLEYVETTIHLVWPYINRVQKNNIEFLLTDFIHRAYSAQEPLDDLYRTHVIRLQYILECMYRETKYQYERKIARANHYPFYALFFTMAAFDVDQNPYDDEEYV